MCRNWAFSRKLCLNQVVLLKKRYFFLVILTLMGKYKKRRDMPSVSPRNLKNLIYNENNYINAFYPKTPGSVIFLPSKIRGRRNLYNRKFFIICSNLIPFSLIKVSISGSKTCPSWQNQKLKYIRYPQNFDKVHRSSKIIMFIQKPYKIGSKSRNYDENVKIGYLAKQCTK